MMGTHDHFLIGSFPFDADPDLAFREACTADSVRAVGNALQPDMSSVPPLFDCRKLRVAPLFHPGGLDGASAFAGIIHAGRSDAPAFGGMAPQAVPDPLRRPVVRSEWIDQFSDTASGPAGHGFNPIARDAARAPGDDFAC
jgi:hypothetical protein